MLFPILLFTEKIPMDVQITGAGGVKVAGDAGVTSNLPTTYVYTSSGGGVQVTGAATAAVSFDYRPAVSGGMVVSGLAGISYEPMLNYTHVAVGGVNVAGASTVAEVIVQIYTIPMRTVEIYLGGDLTVSGVALVIEKIAYTPVGGLLIGGSALVGEHIPMIPAGGVRVGGTAVPTMVFNIVGSGGVRVSGVAAYSITYAVTASGGLSVGGSAALDDKHPLHTPTGGVSAGGVALAYLVKAGTTPTTENPYNTPYAGWALNYESHAPSRYTDLPANSITTFAGVAYISNAGGIYAVDAATDAGRAVNASFTLAEDDFNDSHEKKVPVVYVSASTAGKLKLQAVVNKKAPLYYEFNDDRAAVGEVRGMRATLGKGLVGRFWQFKISNIAGDDFEVDSIEINPVKLARRGA